MNERKAYTPREFAALFGKEKSWTYRQIKAGKITALTDYGRLMISAAEADRILKHCHKEETRITSGPLVSSRVVGKELPPAKTKGASPWMDWIKHSKKCAPRVKSLRRREQTNRPPKFGVKMGK